MFDLPLFGYIYAGLSALLLGFSKSGWKGIGTIIVTLMALAFDTKNSTGVLVPLLVLADCFAVYHYFKHVQWANLWKLIPWMILGVILGTLIGEHISDYFFGKLLAVIIIASAFVMLLLDRIQKENVPDNYWFAGFMGLGAGVTTMIGNLAGVFANVYFLALRFPKNEFIATAAWMFFIINIIKIPFHIWIWQTINMESLKIDLLLAPFVIVGFFIGVRLIKYLDNEAFKNYIIIMTFIGGIMILFK